MLPKALGQILSLCVDEVRDRCSKAGRISGSGLQRFLKKLGCTSLLHRSLIKGCAITYLMHNHISIAAFHQVKAWICKYAHWLHPDIKFVNYDKLFGKYSHWLHHQDRFAFLFSFDNMKTKFVSIANNVDSTYRRIFNCSVIATNILKTNIVSFSLYSL